MIRNILSKHTCSLLLPLPSAAATLLGSPNRHVRDTAQQQTSRPDDATIRETLDLTCMEWKNSRATKVGEGRGQCEGRGKGRQEQDMKAIWQNHKRHETLFGTSGGAAQKRVGRTRRDLK